MIILDENTSWIRLIFNSGGVLRRISLRLLFVTLVAAGVTALHARWDLSGLLTTTPFTLIGFALSIFLGFRNNTSYQRFWEGRILWGRLVNTSRSLTRQIMTLIAVDEAPEHDEGRRVLVRRVAAYVHAVRIHLRSEGDYSQLGRLLPDDDLQALAARSNPPIALLHDLGLRLAGLWQTGRVDTLHLPVLEGSLASMTDIQGGCERIKSTPIPVSYTLLIHRIVAVYCLALPFGLVDTVGLMTPLVVLLVSYAFFGLDAIGDEIENPFGLDSNDLPLSALSTMIEVNVREAVGDGDLPPLHQPVDGVLS
jgi:ion channel-forming bestrophin family protein